MDDVRSLWRPPEVTFLNSATYGLPPIAAWDALQDALEGWRAGTGQWEEWVEEVQRARETWARLVAMPPDRVAVGESTAGLISLVAGALPDDAEVLAAEGDFTSLLYPFAIHADRGVTVRTVPLERLADSVERSTAAVLFSAVQSSNGAVADLDALVAAAADVGALTVVDATQAVGWLPLDASRFDAVACSAYKWLLAPRGVAFLALGERLEGIRPAHASWFSAADVYGSYYGLPPMLAEDARRFDGSPAWFSWVGAAAALDVLESIGIERIHGHAVGLANRFRAGVGLEPSNSAIVSLASGGEELQRAGIACATRAGRARLSFHVYNTADDVEAALAAVG